MVIGMYVPSFIEIVWVLLDKIQLYADKWDRQAQLRKLWSKYILCVIIYMYLMVVPFNKDSIRTYTLLKSYPLVEDVGQINYVRFLTHLPFSYLLHQLTQKNVSFRTDFTV